MTKTFRSRKAIIQLNRWELYVHYSSECQHCILRENCKSICINEKTKIGLAELSYLILSAFILFLTVITMVLTISIFQYWQVIIGVTILFEVIIYNTWHTNINTYTKYVEHQLVVDNIHKCSIDIQNIAKEIK